MRRKFSVLIEVESERDDNTVPDSHPYGVPGEDVNADMLRDYIVAAYKVASLAPGVTVLSADVAQKPAKIGE